jgi:hypothetical protein
MGFCCKGGDAWWDSGVGRRLPCFAFDGDSRFTSEKTGGHWIAIVLAQYCLEQCSSNLNVSQFQFNFSASERSTGDLAEIAGIALNVPIIDTICRSFVFPSKIVYLQERERMRTAFHG